MIVKSFITLHNKTLQILRQYSSIGANLKLQKTALGKNDSLKMRGWQIHNYGELEELQLSDKLRIPQIRNSSECLVRIHTTAINPIDVAMLRGYGSKVLNVLRFQPSAIEFPLILGREFCGELIQRGMGALKSLVLGERVWGVVPLHTNGAHAEYVVVPDYCLSPAPSSLSNEEAAAVLYGGLTAWSGLYVTGHLGGICGALTDNGGGSNKRVLILGGSGNVGSLAIQMLKAQNIQVLTTCNDDAVELVHRSGADYVINYNDSGEMEILRKHAPYDIILDCAGQGAQGVEPLNVDFNQYITFSSPLLRNIDNSGLGLGTLINITDYLQTNVKSFTNKNGIVKYGFFIPAPQGIKFLEQLVRKKKLLPNIDSVFTFDQMPEAFEKVKSGHLRGKVVVNLNNS